MTEIHGRHDPKFAAVADALAANMADGGEIGEAIAVMFEGEPVVDLWAGYRDGAQTLPWEADTPVCIFSVGKPPAACRT